MSAYTEQLVQPLRLWSVTTLIKQGLGTGEPLVNWGIRQTAKNAVDEHDVITAMLMRGDHESAVEHIVNLRWRKQREAMWRGTEIHAAAEAIVLGQQPEIPDHIALYVEQYARWLDRFAPRMLLAEAPVYNLTQRYAGTLDGVMELDGRPLLYDIKTTPHPPGGEKTRPPFPEVALQLVAYRNAELVGVLAEQRYAAGKRFYLYDPTIPHEVMPQVEGALCLVLSPYDCSAIPVRVDDEIWDAFRYVLANARWTQETSKSLFGATLALAEQEATA